MVYLGHMTENWDGDHSPHVRKPPDDANADLNSFLTGQGSSAQEVVSKREGA